MSASVLWRVGVITLLVSSFAPGDVQAAWSLYPDINLPIGSATGYQVYPSILEDGAGGAFIAWHDNRGPNYDIYMQRVSATGVPLWAANGVAVCSAAGDQANTQMVSDGAGGVIVAWHDFRAGHWDVYVQRLNANGVAQWTTNGVALCTATGDQTNPFLVPDGLGGAIVAWVDGRPNPEVHVYARRVNAAGAPQWTANGVPVCVSGSISGGVRIATDGANGAIITWHDMRSGLNNVFAQRLNASGSPQWLANGVRVAGAAETHQDPEIVSDGTGGAFIAWAHITCCGPRYIRMQRVSALGAMQWAADGLLVADGSGTQQSVQLASDGAGGVIAGWQNFTGTFFRTYAQRMSSAGTRLWGTNGVSATVGGFDHADPRLASDGAGGVILTWCIPANGESI